MKCVCLIAAVVCALADHGLKIDRNIATSEFGIFAQELLPVAASSAPSKGVKPETVAKPSATSVAKRVAKSSAKPPAMAAEVPATSLAAKPTAGARASIAKRSLRSYQIDAGKTSALDFHNLMVANASESVKSTFEELEDSVHNGIISNESRTAAVNFTRLLRIAPQLTLRSNAGVAAGNSAVEAPYVVNPSAGTNVSIATQVTASSVTSEAAATERLEHISIHVPWLEHISFHVKWAVAASDKHALAKSKRVLTTEAATQEVARVPDVPVSDDFFNTLDAATLGGPLAKLLAAKHEFEARAGESADRIWVARSQVANIRSNVGSLTAALANADASSSL